MRSIISSFWINIVSGIISGAFATLIAKYPLGLTLLYSVGVGALIFAIVFTLAYIILRPKRRYDKNKSATQKIDSFKQLKAEIISGGTVIQADSIGQVQVREIKEQAPEATSDEQIRFITEGIRQDQKGFRVVLSIWNNQMKAIKLFEFLTKEYVRHNSVEYYGGARHYLSIVQDDTSLWDGETYEIPPGESASFDLKYTIKTGPADGEPWIVFGIIARYHDPTGMKRELHSNAIYILAEGSVGLVSLSRLGELNASNMFIHRIYADTLKALSNHLSNHRDKIAQLMIDDYGNGLIKLKEAISANTANEDLDEVCVQEKHLLALVNEERLSPLAEEKLAEKEKILECLNQLSAKHCHIAFVHLCQPG